MILEVGGWMEEGGSQSGFTLHKMVSLAGFTILR